MQQPEEASDDGHSDSLVPVAKMLPKERPLEDRELARTQPKQLPLWLRAGMSAGTHALRALPGDLRNSFDKSRITET